MNGQQATSFSGLRYSAPGLLGGFDPYAMGPSVQSPQNLDTDSDFEESDFAAEQHVALNKKQKSNTQDASDIAGVVRSIRRRTSERKRPATLDDRIDKKPDIKAMGSKTSTSVKRREQNKIAQREFRAKTKIDRQEVGCIGRHPGTFCILTQTSERPAARLLPRTIRSALRTQPVPDLPSARAHLRNQLAQARCVARRSQIQNRLYHRSIALVKSLYTDHSARGFRNAS
jgi:hypothetical protein